jgi:hypothetical protein
MFPIRRAYGRSRFVVKTLSVAFAACLSLVVPGVYVTAADAVTLVSVSGKVVDTNNHPVAGAPVGIYATEQAFTTTASDGTYTISNVPTSSSPYDVQLIVPCHRDQHTSVLVGGSVTGVNFTVPAAADKDSFGYACQGSANETYITADGNTGIFGDDVSLSVALPFPFKFYGVNYTTVNIGTNGLASFTQTATQSVNKPLPEPTDAPGAAIFPYWDDLDMTVAAGSGIFTQTIGTAPHRQFVIEWRNMIFYTDSNSSNPAVLDFEAVLGEDNKVTFNYILPYSTAETFRTHGTSATVGIQNANGTVALQRSFNQPYLISGQSIVFTAPK